MRWTGGLAAALALALCTAGTAAARTEATLSLEVTFGVSGAISVTLPSGMAVGSVTGPPTVIPAGWYSIKLTDPGCVELPYFQLSGPGVSILDNMQGGEVPYDEYMEDLAPDSTFSWIDSADPSQVYTFETSGDIVGTAPAAGTAPFATSGKVVSNHDLVGSALPAPVGSLRASVTPAGVIQLEQHGKPVTSIKAGRYVMLVIDRRASGRLTLSGNERTMTLATAPIASSRSVSLDLTTGTWTIRSGGRAKPYVLRVE